MWHQVIYGRPNRNAAGGLRDIIHSVECEFYADVCLCYHNSHDTYYGRIKNDGIRPLRSCASQLDYYPSPRWGLDSNTSCWGGGARAPLRSPKLLDRFQNFKRHSIALYVNYPYKVKNLTRRSLMTSQVRSKSEFSTFRAWWHRRVKFRC